MEFGVFDHLDKNDRPLARYYAERLEGGFGRGAAAAEIRFFGVDPAQTEQLYEQTVAFILEGMRDGAVTVPEEGGKQRRMPLAVAPLQKPHPPLWYGVHSPRAG